MRGSQGCWLAENLALFSWEKSPLSTKSTDKATLPPRPPSPQLAQQALRLLPDVTEARLPGFLDHVPEEVSPAGEWERVAIENGEVALLAVNAERLSP